MTKYKCRECGSLNIEGTMPAWFKVNDPALPIVDVDVEAQWESGFCGGCGNSGAFDEVCEEI